MKQLLFLPSLKHYMWPCKQLSTVFNSLSLLISWILVPSSYNARNGTTTTYVYTYKEVIQSRHVTYRVWPTRDYFSTDAALVSTTCVSLLSITAVQKSWYIWNSLTQLSVSYSVWWSAIIHLLIHCTSSDYVQWSE